jgi:hypothetical protein
MDERRRTWTAPIVTCACLFRPSRTCRARHAARHRFQVRTADRGTIDSKDRPPILRPSRDSFHAASHAARHDTATQPFPHAAGSTLLLGLRRIADRRPGMAIVTKLDAKYWRSSAAKSAYDPSPAMSAPFPVKCSHNASANPYFRFPSMVAHAWATAELALSVPSEVAQPPFSTKLPCM